MGINCTFTDSTFQHGESLYGCHVEGMQTPESRELELTGQHATKKGNNSVAHLQFVNCVIVKIPQGVTKLFPNLISIIVNSSKLKKISKNDLAEYRNLQKFICGGNELEYLPGDLFEGFKDLEHISFWGNNLKVIEPNILDGLNKIKHVSFINNPNYSKCYSIYPTYNPNASLQEVKIDLHDKFFARFKFLDDLKKSEQNLKQEVQNHNQKINEVVANFTDQLTIANGNNTFLKDKIDKLLAKVDKKSFLTLDIKAFLQDDTTKDFLIQIDDHEFPVHKFLLAARSPTLAEILKNNPEVENLNLVDISVEIFEIILKFLYTDELPGDDGTNFLHLFAAAGKLKIKELRKFAGNKVIEQIDEDNAIDIFKLGFKYDNAEIMQKAFDKIKEKYPKIIFKDEWAVDPDKVIKIIEIFKKKEEAMRKIEEEFEKSLNLNL
ncbi:hypothetical protein ACKWTF_015275 [Chironomus riparius]